MTNWVQDAGHGGSDPGAMSHGNVEKVYTLEAELYVAKRLKDHGIKTDVTRTSDTTLEEHERVAKVRQYKYCISHHFNAGGGTGAEFIHSIYADGKFEHILKDEFEKAGYPTRRVFCRKGRTGDYYYMHRSTGSCRTTIVEYDFVDGKNANKIKDKSYRVGMYECVVRAICRHEGVMYKPIKGVEDEMLEKAIVINSFADYPSAEPLANRLGAPIYTKHVAKNKQVAKQVIVAGGTKDGLKADKFIVLSGKDRYETAQEINKYYKSLK